MWSTGVVLATLVVFFGESMPAQSVSGGGPMMHMVRVSVQSSQVESWEEAVGRVAADAHEQGLAWRIYQSDLSEYLLFAPADSGSSSRIVDGFVGAPGRPTEPLFMALREVLYEVTQRDTWRAVSRWSTHDELDPAAYASIAIHRYRVKPEMRDAVDSLFGAQAGLLREVAYPHPVIGYIESERRQEVMVIVLDPMNPGDFVTEHGAGPRWQSLMRDIARVLTAHSTVRGVFVPELSVPPSR